MGSIQYLNMGSTTTSLGVLGVNHLEQPAGIFNNGAGSHVVDGHLHASAHLRAGKKKKHKRRGGGESAPRERAGAGMVGLTKSGARSEGRYSGASSCRPRRCLNIGTVRVQGVEEQRKEEKEGGRRQVQL